MNIQDWFPLGLTGLDLLAVQGTLKSHLQHHSLKAQILWHSAFFMIQVTSIHDYWKNHSFDYSDLCQQSDVSASDAVLLCHSFSSKKQVSFNFRAVVTVCSDYGAQENKACHCLHCLMQWSSFVECWVLSQLFHSPLSSRFSLVSLCFLP